MNPQTILLDNEKLWRVDDSLMEHPEAKFRKPSSPLIELTSGEQWGFRQFENAKIPEKMLRFVDGMIRRLGLTCSRFSNIKDICREVLWRIEFEQPYYFLVDTLVQLEQGGEELKTYRHRTTGDILDPARIEIFRYKRDWDFKPYNVVVDMFNHPGMIRFLKSNVLPPQFKSRDDAMTHVLSKISEVVWGDFGWLTNFVDEMLIGYEETMTYDDPNIKDVYDRQEASDALSGDALFWLACSLGAMTWFKGPDAVEFLAQYHVVYGQIVDIIDDKFVLISDKYDEVIVDGANVYTHQDFEELPARAPDTCINCGVVTHCTKYVNATAILHPICSCGEKIDPMNAGNDAYDHYSMSCEAYKRAYPVRSGFVCQRCIFKAIHNLPQEVVCGRAVCPATNCPHHQGPAARLRALTQQRTKQLTAAQ